MTRGRRRGGKKFISPYKEIPIEQARLHRKKVEGGTGALSSWLPWGGEERKSVNLYEGQQRVRPPLPKRGRPSTRAPDQAQVVNNEAWRKEENCSNATCNGKMRKTQLEGQKPLRGVRWLGYEALLLKAEIRPTRKWGLKERD